MTNYVDNIIQSLEVNASSIQQYKALISLQCLATPQEWIEFIKKTKPLIITNEFGSQIQALFHIIFHKNQKPHNYSRRDIHNTISMYHSSSVNRKLLVAFTGRAQVLFGPIARVLQYFPCNQFDVLVLRDTSKLGYTNGLPGHSNSFYDLITKIRDLYISNKYKDLYCIGTSGGGGPALVAASMIDARVGVSFSGRPPTSSKIYGDTEIAMKMESTLAEFKNRNNSLTAIYPTNHKDDVTNAYTLNKLGNVNLFPVHGYSDHNVLHDLDLAGSLSEVLIQCGLLPTASL